MLRSSEHQNILQMLERDARDPDRGGREGGAAKILDLPDVPDLLALPVEPISWLVDRMIPRAAVTLVAGEPGSYKSWLALRLGRSVAEGAAFLERACPALPVLYLDRENPQAVVRERMAVLGIRSAERLRVWGGWLEDAPPGIGDARLLQIARRWKPLILFDSFIRFHECDENSATEMAPVMGELRALAHAGATVVALHHRAKSEASRYRGSSDILGGVDVAFAVSRDRDAGLVKLQCFKSRFASEFSITLRPELESNGDFALADPPAVSREGSDVEALRRLISTEPGLSQREVVRRAGLPQSRGIELLRREEGRAWRTKRGSHGAIRYYPPSSIDQEEQGPTGPAQLFSPQGVKS
jgi:AAA domain-containing protein